MSLFFVDKVVFVQGIQRLRTIMKNSQTFRNFEVGEPGSNIKTLSLNLVLEFQLPKRTLLQTDESKKKNFVSRF